MPYFDVIPEGVRRELDAHAATGDEDVSSFVEAVLRNDLRRAVCLASDEELAAIRPIVHYVHNELPGLCWGSEERVRAWRAHHRASLIAQRAVETGGQEKQP